MLFFIAFFCLGCTEIAEEPAAPVTAESKRVLVVMNKASGASQEIGRFYIKKRGIPPENVLMIKTTLSETATQEEFEKDIRDPVLEAVKSSKNKIDFVVMTKGVPIRIVDGRGYSVDSMIAGHGLPRKALQGQEASINPFFNKGERFTRGKYGMVLVTRLDGYTVEDAKRLVTSSLEAEPHKGPFLIDMDPGKTGGGYKSMHDASVAAASHIKSKGFEVVLDQSRDFIAPRNPIAGYVGWGSNDASFNLTSYRALAFKPGAIAETFVSTSARTFTTTTGGQSLIADLVEHGITGIKGYVSEPYTVALCQPGLLFDRYTSGWTLAEAFYCSSPLIGWKDLVIGDPICNPYAKGGMKTEIKGGKRMILPLMKSVVK